MTPARNWGTAIAANAIALLGYAAICWWSTF